MSEQQVNVVRDGLRFSLAAEDPIRYAHGRYVSVADIVTRLLRYSSPVSRSSLVCANEHAFGRLQYSHSNVSLMSVAEHFTGSLQDWSMAVRTRLRSCCSVCSTPFFHVSSFLRLVPLIGFELVTSDGVEICRNIKLSVDRSSDTVSYSLFGVLYFADAHYMSRFVSSSGDVWFHDGLVGSDMVFDGHVGDLSSLCSRGAAKAAVVLYAKR